MQPDELDLRKLRAFQLVAKYGGLSAAAKHLKQTVPAVSQKIRRLEKDLGVELFERLPNGLTPTAAGRRLLVASDAVLDRAEQALREISPPSSPAGSITISVGSDSSWFVVPVLSRFLQRCPDVKLDLQVVRGPEAVSAVVRGDIDVSFGIFAKVPKTLTSVALVDTSLCLVCPRGHPLSKKSAIRCADIAAYRLIVPPRYGASRSLMERGMSANSEKANCFVEVASCVTAMAFAKAGVGVAVVHSMCLDQLSLASMHLIKLEPLFGALTFRAVHRRGLRSALVSALLEEFRY